MLILKVTRIIYLAFNQKLPKSNIGLCILQGFSSGIRLPSCGSTKIIKLRKYLFQNLCLPCTPFLQFYAPIPQI